jgi:hypothetical protein
VSNVYPGPIQLEVPANVSQLLSVSGLETEDSTVDDDSSLVLL